MSLLKIYKNQKSRALESMECNSQKNSVASGLSLGPGKVRYLFQSRRRIDQNQHSIFIVGRDKSYPLEPLKKHSPIAENISRSKTFTSQTVDRIVPRFALHERNFSLDRCKSFQNQKGSNFNFKNNSDNKCLKLKKTNFVGIHHGNQIPGLKTSNHGVNCVQDTLKSDRCNSDYHQVLLYDTENPILPNSLVVDGHDGSLQNMEEKFQNFTNKNIASKKSQTGTSAQEKRTKFLSKPTLKKMGSSATTLATPKLPENRSEKNPLLTSSVNQPYFLLNKDNALPVKFYKEASYSVHSKPDLLSSDLVDPSKFSFSSTKKLCLPSFFATTAPDSNAIPSSDLIKCRICKRSFASDRILKHETICQKTKKSKRKPFDTLQQRIGGTEAEKYLKKPLKAIQNYQKQESRKLNNDWRKNHEEFIKNIRAAKEMSFHLKNGGKLSDLPPMPAFDYSDYTKCPYCLRKFNEAAAKRHIPKCFNINNNKVKP